MSESGHRDSRGVQAYRWIVMSALALLGAMSMRVLNQIDKAAVDAAASLHKIEALQGQVTSVQGQMSKMEGQVNDLKATTDSVRHTTNAFDNRLTTQEHRLGALERQLAKQLEEVQRMLWSKKP